MTTHLLRPDFESKSVITSISIDFLRKKGLKFLLLDVDGTLVSENSLIPDTDTISWIKSTKLDFSLFLISNNPSLYRISTVAKSLDLPFIYRALKPSRKSLLKAIDHLECELSEVAIVGDKIFTDILAGNRLGIYTILVKSMNQSKKIYNISLEKLIAKILGA